MRHIGVGDFRTTPKMREYINRVLDSNRLSHGPFSRQFEQEFSALHGCKFGVLSNSGTSSLQVALQTLKELHGWNDGDEVIVPAVTFVATVNVVLHNRLTPVLVDVEPDYYGLDVSKVSSAVTDRTRAIFPVHTFGMPCNLAPIVSSARYNNLKVIEDSCECMFATYYRQPVGLYGDIACFSQYIAHILTTGVGGIATTNNSDYAAKMRSLVNHGRDGIYLSIDDDDEPTQEIIRRRFNFESIGYSYRITELEAALAVAQLETWQDNIAKRQSNAAYLYAGLKHLWGRLQLPEIRPNASHSFMMFPIVLREGDKWDLCNFLEQRGIETREMLRLTDQPCYRGLWNPDGYPVAKWLDEQGFYIGCHPGLDRDDLDYIIEAFEDYFNEH